MTRCRSMMVNYSTEMDDFLAAGDAFCRALDFAA
jgi:hypothetical protein